MYLRCMKLMMMRIWYRVKLRIREKVRLTLCSNLYSMISTIKTLTNHTPPLTPPVATLSIVL